MRLERILLGGAVAVAMPLAAGWMAGLRVNLTESIPRGVYRVVRGGVSDGMLRRGEIVLVCLPPDIAAFARARGYVPGGGECEGGAMPVGKDVVAVAGDTVMVSASGLAVNGHRLAASAPRARDRGGRLLPGVRAGAHDVRAGELWLGSRSPFGFDGRYFGAVPAAGVRAQLIPFWVSPRSSERDVAEQGRERSAGP